MSSLVSFLKGKGLDDSGRTIEDVLGYADRELEQEHDFIQWLFPLPERSRAVPVSPVLSGDDSGAIRASAAAQRNLEAAAARMLRFFEVNRHWLRPHDHNHLRITRIIRSLRLLVGDEAADSFRERIRVLAAEAGAPINSTTLSFWGEA